MAQSRVSLSSDDGQESSSLDQREGSSLTALRQDSLGSLAYESLRVALLRGEFQPGEQLDLAKLCERLAVSMTPLKVALARLANQGLVEIRPRSGTYVTALTEATLQEVTTARIVLETWAGRNVGDHATAPDWEDLDALLCDSEQLIQAPSNDIVAVQERFVDLDAAFHRRLIAVCSNDPLTRFFDSLGVHVMLARAWCLDSRENLADRMHKGVKEHQAIVRALQRNDADRAVSIIQRHIEKSTARASAIIKQHGGVI